MGNTALPGATRSVRVFISSTFQDMQGEREELVKRIFPRLRKLCESRGVTWGEVDLRWGVTDEQRAEGSVLPICFAEIERCWPFFIGFLGHRFGWVPDEIPPALIEREPWLAQHNASSVTELEFLHGVLNDPSKAAGSFFYFRSRRFIEALPPEQRERFEEAPTPLEIDRLGRAGAARLSDERRRKLASLKQRIRDSGVPFREDYPDPIAVGEMVYNDLVSAIDKLYPAGEQVDPLDREAAEHNAFAASRASIYVGGSAYFARLDAHIAPQSAPNSARGLAIVGKAGSGKSALLASWALRYHTGHAASEKLPKRLWQKLADTLRGPRAPSHAAPLLLAHFVGATAASADPDAMLRRLIGELNRRLNLQHEIPDKPDALRAAFANCLHMAAAKRRIVLVIDGLNQIDHPDQVALVWLPEHLPDNLRVIVSTLEGPALGELGRRGWSRLDVEALGAQDRAQLIAEFLAQYRKALSLDRARRIEQAEQTGNPLFLRTLLDELRLHGEHWTLDDCIDRCLGAPSLDDLFERILDRYERDFSRERPHLVRDALTLLWSARRGLLEGELLELLGADGEPLPQAIWSPLNLAAEASLVTRSGLITFSHDYLRVAVQRRYLPTARDRTAAYLRLADYFSAQDLGRRTLEELPWQLARAGAWQALRDRLADLEFFTRAWDHDRLDVKRHWVDLEEHSEHRVANAYDGVIRNPEEYVERFGLGLANLATLLFDAGAVQAGRAIGDFLWRHYQVAAAPQDAAGRRANQLMHAILGTEGLGAGGAWSQPDSPTEPLTNGDIVEAMLRIFNGEIGSVHTLDSQVSLLIAQSHLDDAMTLLEEKERLVIKHRNEAGQGDCLVTRAIILSRRGALDEALALLRQGERIGRTLGDKVLVQSALGHQAHLMNRRCERERALTLFKEQEAICRELGLQENLVDCIANQAIVFRERGELDRALSIFQEAERRAREWGNKRKVMAALGNQATVLAERRDFDAAMARFDDVADMARALGDKSTLHTTLGNQAGILTERGDLDRAFQLIEEKTAMCRELGDKRGLADALEKIVVIHTKRGDFDTSLERSEEAMALCKELGDSRGVVQLLLVQGLCTESLRRMEDAVRHVEEAYLRATASGLTDLVREIEPARQRLRSKADAERSIDGWRVAVEARPDDPESHNDLAVALFQAGDVEGAIAELHEVIRLSPTSAMGYFGMGVIYAQTGRLHAALEQFRLAHRIDPSPMTLEACKKLERDLDPGAQA